MKARVLGEPPNRWGPGRLHSQHGPIYWHLMLDQGPPDWVYVGVVWQIRQQLTWPLTDCLIDRGFTWAGLHHLVVDPRRLL